MAVLLGKRKRIAEAVKEIPAAQEDSASEDDEAARKAFQLAFEAKFKPLENEQRQSTARRDDLEFDEVGEDEDDENEDSDSDHADENGSNEDIKDDSEWSGFDADEDGPPVQVVNHTETTNQGSSETNRILKSFMTAKPPKSSTLPIPTSSKPQTSTNPTDDTSDAAHLANDLALQRLLKESHLLDPTTFHNGPTTSIQPEGRSRLLAQALRLQDLGAKSSHLKQESMPMAHRKGIVSKGVEKEGKRRREARENGIVLERAAGGKGREREVERRSRGGRGGKGAVGSAGPTVGKFSGGTLRLSSRDVRSIQGDGGRRGGGRGGRGGRRGGGGKKALSGLGGI